MTDLFWLLLPVAAASGWYLARRRQGYELASRQVKQLPADYLKGLNYILNEQPDKAIEVFINMLEVQSDTVETHMALGNLFRRRGEVDRAIRIHQNLIARPALSDEARYHALLELGTDYMRAGLLDRAERLFRELLDAHMHIRPALQQLLDIKQQEQDWEEAIQYARRFESVSGRSMYRQIAQYHCEQATAAITEGDSRRARDLTRRALSEDPACVRASLLLGRMELDAGQPRLAIQALQQIEQQNPGFLPEGLAMLKQAYASSGRDGDYVRYLQGICEQHGGVSVILALCDEICQHQGITAGIEFLRQEMDKRPSIKGLDRLAELSLDVAEGEARRFLQIAHKFSSRMKSRRPVYCCEHCGFSGKTLHWQCPSCKYWNTIKPIQGIEGE